MFGYSGCRSCSRLKERGRGMGGEYKMEDMGQVLKIKYKKRSSRIEVL